VQPERNPTWRDAQGLRRLAVLGQLRRVSDLAAAFWHDACVVLDQPNFFSVPTHLVDHALRELDGILLDLLLPDGSVIPKQESRSAKVSEIAASLGLSAEVAEVWTNLRFNETVHRRPPFPKTDGEEFRTRVDGYTGVLEGLAAAFEAKFVRWMERIDALVASAPEGQVARIRVAVPWTEVTVNYFFSLLKDPAWLGPTAEAGFYDRPPAVEIADDSGAARFHTWPQGAYLERVAHEASEVVSQIVAAMPHSNNPYLLSGLVAIAAAIPVASYDTVDGRIREGIASSAAVEISNRSIVKLVRCLVAASRVEQALTIARELLWISLPTNDEVGTPGIADLRSPAARLRPYDYAESAREVLNVFDGHGLRLEVVGLFRELLSNANVASSTDSGASAPYDYSGIWRSTLGGDPNGPGEIRQALVTTTRDAARRSATMDPPEIFQEVVDRLLGMGWHIGTRLAIDAAAHCGTESSAVASGLLLDRELFDAWHFEGELSALLASCFGRLEPAQQSLVLDWIVAGPATPWVVPPEIEVDRDKKSARLETLGDEWRLARLWPLQAALPAEWVQQFQEIQQRSGRLEPRYNTPRFTSWTGTNSPLTPNDIQEMPAAELVSFLTEWQSDEQWHPDAPSFAGLADALRQAVSQNPAQFVNLIEVMARHRPIYIQAVVAAANDAVKQNRDVPWPALFSLARSIIDDADLTDARHEEGGFISRESRRHALLASLIDCLDTGLLDYPGGIEPTDRFVCFGLVRRLFDDLSPTPDECRGQPENDTLFTLTFDSIRGGATRLVMSYLAWLRRRELASSILECPEIEELIAERLRLEPSSATLAYLGRSFTILASFDVRWAAAVSEMMFVERPQKTGRFDEWCGYLEGPVEPLPFAITRQGYLDHLDRLPSQTEVRDCDRSLAHHLLQGYWSDLTPPLGENGEKPNLLAKFFAVGSDDLRSYALQYTGSCMSQTAGDLGSEVSTRLTELWDWRRSSIESSGDPTGHACELSAFEWWFTSDKLNTEWGLNNLEWTLKLGPGPEHPYQVVRKLAQLAAQHQDQLSGVIRCLDQLSKKCEMGGFIGCVPQLQDVLGQAAQGTAHAQVRVIANRFLANGFHQFRALAEQ
jgi:hypothetical protein